MIHFWKKQPKDKTAKPPQLKTKPVKKPAKKKAIEPIDFDLDDDPDDPDVDVEVEPESASDYVEETLALITSEEHSGDDSEQETQYMATEDADMYENLVAQHVLSVQVTQAEQN